MLKIALDKFLTKHQLPHNYSQVVEQIFFPIAKNIVQQKKHKNETLVLGINGAQGSGKRTLADLFVLLFENEFELNAVALSLDAFYYALEERKYLARTIHPLLQTRGVLGTHDIPIAFNTLQQVISK